MVEWQREREREERSERTLALSISSQLPAPSSQSPVPSSLPAIHRATLPPSPPTQLVLFAKLLPRPRINRRSQTLPV
ncbi:hypothetical protein BofuT4_uP147380.1 [Botrytis cinerea T4]|uniref:Uncharacterized protein n=1 Tax=Botryotinia fuckeliana (strain T4) TaxID=999810 RepID=G2YXF7_BOTF4|nr:hypothetical protein BofuT4_uP147380.1 [Botrytis cinerea T4]